MVRRYDILPELSCMHFYEDGDYVLYKDYAALEARVAELEKDATRYRWLCNGNWYAVEGHILHGYLYGKDLTDIDIDEAMSREA